MEIVRCLHLAAYLREVTDIFTVEAAGHLLMRGAESGHLCGGYALAHFDIDLAPRGEAAALGHDVAGAVDVGGQDVGSCLLGKIEGSLVESLNAAVGAFAFGEDDHVVAVGHRLAHDILQHVERLGDIDEPREAEEGVNDGILPHLAAHEDEHLRAEG